MSIIIHYFMLTFLKLKVLVSYYGSFPTLIFYTLNPFNRSITSLKRWHYRLVNIKGLLDVYGNIILILIIYALIAINTTLWLSAFVTIEEIVGGLVLGLDETKQFIKTLFPRGS